MYLEKNHIMKALVTLAIEKTLLNIGKPFYEKVSSKLQKEYKCYIPDCYDHPECLESVLKSIFGNSHGKIVETIREELIEQLDDHGVRILIKTLGR